MRKRQLMSLYLGMEGRDVIEFPCLLSIGQHV